MVELNDLVSFANDFLEVDRFRDYCPNGLQVEGRPQVAHLVSGVTASRALLEAAHEAGADAILVHHGYFWKGEASPVVGIKQQRLKLLLTHDISLLAYHLPLDAHPRVGNNACLGLQLGLSVEGQFGDAGGVAIGLHGCLEVPLKPADFARHLAATLQRTPLHVAGESTTIRTVAWCSGAAQGYLDAAADLGVDAFVTGEASEQSFHIARERGVHFFAAGHHATERYGVAALGDWLAEQFGLRHTFIDIENPI
ncbi:MAG TPA: Nif3-like dinuclear metal center hexameric protein [Gammaproteobacteria bacterium]|nr:Nif3-like dinuclear metal center hexameric protein [Gammaproteobacteria bacterium]